MPSRVEVGDAGVGLVAARDAQACEQVVELASGSCPTAAAIWSWSSRPPPRTTPPT